MSADEDAALNARVASGDRVAFQLLLLRHEPRLRAFLGRLAGSSVGDELAQEAFLKAWLRASDYRGQGSYAAWLAGIGWRLFLDNARRARRRTALWGYDSVTDETIVTTDAAEAIIDVDKLLRTLPNEQRAALVLCDGHGWSHGEAAAILNIPLGTVKSLVLRAKQRLRAKLAEGQ